MPHAPSRLVRLARVGVPVLMAAGLALSAVGPAIAAGESADPAATASPGTAAGEPVSTLLPEVSPGDMPIDDPLGIMSDGAIPIQPDPAIIDPRAVAWERIVVAPDGRTLEIYFWMGVEECNGLHSVEIRPTEGGVSVAVLTGIPEGAESRICIELAQLYRTSVTLDRPLIEGGVE